MDCERPFRKRREKESNLSRFKRRTSFQDEGLTGPDKGFCPNATEEGIVEILHMKQINQRKLFTLAAAALLGVSFLKAGCDKTVSQTEETKVKSDGSVQTKEKTVTESPDGSLNKTETKKTTEPSGETKTETKIISTNKP